MSESLTGTASIDTGLTTEPTGEVQAPVTAETQNQEAISTETASESKPAEQTPSGEQKQTQKGSEASTDDGLAKFAKSQGFDPDNLTDGERRALKIAHDNQRAYRTSTNKPSVVQEKAEVEGGITKDEVTAFEREFRIYQAQKQADSFFSQEGRDKSLEPVMASILNEKKSQYGNQYASVLSKDLDLLYNLAVIKNGGNLVDEDAIRREERESINRHLSASTPTAHASQTTGDVPQKVDEDWIENYYDPRNPEQRKLVDEYYSR